MTEDMRKPRARKRDVQGTHQTAAAPSKKKRATRSLEFRPMPGDEELARHLYALQEERGTLAGLYREALHEGLLLRAVLLGPDEAQLFAGRYSLNQMAQLVRQQALGLVDLLNRSNAPLAAAYPPPYLQAIPVSGGGASPSPETGTQAPEMARMNTEGAAKLRGLGTGLLKKRVPSSSEGDGMALGQNSLGKRENV